MPASFLLCNFLARLLKLESCCLRDCICAIVLYNWLNRSFLHSEFQRLANWILLFSYYLLLIDKGLLWLKLIGWLCVLRSGFLSLLLLCWLSHSRPHLSFRFFNLFYRFQILISSLLLSGWNAGGIHRSFMLVRFWPVKRIWTHGAQVSFLHLFCLFLWWRNV